MDLRRCSECGEPVMDHVLSGQQVAPQAWHLAFFGRAKDSHIRVGAQIFKSEILAPARPSQMGLVLNSAGLIPLQRGKTG